MGKVVFGLALGLVVAAVVTAVGLKRAHDNLLSEDIFPEDWGWTW